MSMVYIAKPISHGTKCRSCTDAVSSFITLIHFVIQSICSSLPSLISQLVFTEICDTCNTEHVRNFEIQSIGLKYTGRNCSLGSCPGKLKDTLLDWEDLLPQTEWDRAQEECLRADLVLCLGTSLRIEPAGSLCTLPFTNDAPEVSGGGKKATGGRKKKRSTKMKETKLGYAIVNLQPTPYDDGAALVIRGKVDDVMKGIMEKLGYDAWEKCDRRKGIDVVTHPAPTSHSTVRLQTDNT